jgi:hypothetical protein
MPQAQPTLPTNRAFVVQFRAQPSGAPADWEARVEHVVSGQVDTLRLAGRVTGVHAPRADGGVGTVKRGGVRGGDRRSSCRS